MSKDGKLRDDRQPCVRVSISIDPVDHVAGDIAGLVGNFAFDLSQVVGLSRQTGSKLNVQLIEEVTDVLEHGPSRDGELKVALAIAGDEFVVDVTAPRVHSDDPWSAIATAEDPKKLLADTVRERRVDRAKGGFELHQGLGSGSKKKPPGSSGGMSGAPALLEYVPLRKKS